MPILITDKIDSRVKNTYDAGVTIVEILAVVMIIAIVGMAGAWLHHQNSGSIMLRNCSLELLSAIQSARLPAGKLHYPTQLHVNLDDQSYYLSVSEPDYSALLEDTPSDLGQGSANHSSDILNLDLNKPRQLPEGVTFRQVRYITKNGTVALIFSG